MNFYIKLALLLTISFLASCSTLHKIAYDDNDFFSKKEQEIFDDIAMSIDYRRGFDIKYRLNYLYAAGKFKPEEYRSRSNFFVLSLKRHSPEDCFDLYKKSLRNRSYHRLLH